MRKWLLILLLVVICVPTTAKAGSSDTVTVMARPPGWLGAPTDFVITQLNSEEARLDWTKNINADNTVIRRKIGSYPTDVTDGIEVYNGSGETYTDTDLSLDREEYYYRAWSEASSVYSDDYAQGTVGGTIMLTLALILLCLGLMAAGFYFKNTLLLIAASLAWFGYGIYEVVSVDGGLGDIGHVFGGVGILMAIICAYKTIDTWMHTRAPNEMSESDRYRKRLDNLMAPPKHAVPRYPRRRL